MRCRKDEGEGECRNGRTQGEEREQEQNFTLLQNHNVDKCGRRQACILSIPCDPIPCFLQF